MKSDLQHKVTKLLSREGVLSVYTEFGGDPSKDGEVYKRYCATKPFQPSSYTEEVVRTVDADFVARLESALNAMAQALEALEHPWIPELDCECGYYGDGSEYTGMSQCPKCAVAEARASLHCALDKIGESK